MATGQTGQYRRQTTYERTYIDGNTVRKLDVRRAIEEEPRRNLSHAARKNREKAHHMSIGYVTFLVAALLVAGFVLINYIQMQYDMTSHVEQIAQKESELNALRQANDEAYLQIVTGVDLEEIKRIAVGELGMTYAAEGQIITYTAQARDYVRQYGDIPE